MTRYWLLAWGLFIAGSAACLMWDSYLRQPREHHVRRGETLFSIARDHYGRGRLYTMVAEANGKKAPYILKEGEVLLLPSSVGAGRGITLATTICLFALILLPIEAAAFHAAGKITGERPVGRAVEAACLAALYTAAAGVWLAGPLPGTNRLTVAVVLLALTALRYKSFAAVYELKGRSAVWAYAASRPVVMTGVAFLLLAGVLAFGERIAPLVEASGLSFILN